MDVNGLNNNSVRRLHVDAVCRFLSMDFMLKSMCQNGYRTLKLIHLFGYRKMLDERPKVLILDASGYIGKFLYETLGRERAEATYYKSSVEGCVYYDAVSMDLADTLKDPRLFSHAVILIAIPNPDLCAMDVNKSYAINVDSIKNIIDYLSRWDIKPVFTSTESVFDGGGGYYGESDPVNPIMTYGEQKVEVEQYIQEKCDKFIIARLAKVVGDTLNDGTLFTNWLDQLLNNETIYCAYDQTFSPIHVEDVVNSIIRLIELDCDGIFHVCSQQPYTRLELLHMLVRQLKTRTDTESEVIPCSIHEFDVMEKRPQNVSMNPGKLIDATGIQIRSVEKVVSDVVEHSLLNV